MTAGALLFVADALARASGARKAISVALLLVSGARERVSSALERVSSGRERVSGGRERVSGARVRVAGRLGKMQGTGAGTIWGRSQGDFMSDDDLLQRSRLKRILVFDADNSGAFPAAGPMRDVLTRVAALDAELDALAPAQETALAQSKGGTATLHQLLDAVHDDLVDLSEISQAAADENPAIRDLFRLPAGERQQNWIDAADAVPAKLTPYLALFEGYGLEPGFLADLSADVAAYKSAFGDRSGHRQSRSGDTDEIEEKIVEGKKLVKKLDVFAGRRFKGDAALMGKWMEASTLGVGQKAHRAVAPAKV